MAILAVQQITRGGPNPALTAASASVLASVSGDTVMPTARDSALKNGSRSHGRVSVMVSPWQTISERPRTVWARWTKSSSVSSIRSL